MKAFFSLSSILINCLNFWYGNKLNNLIELKLKSLSLFIPIFSGENIISLMPINFKYLIASLIWINKILISIILNFFCFINNSLNVVSKKSKIKIILFSTKRKSYNLLIYLFWHFLRFSNSSWIKDLSLSSNFKNSSLYSLAI